MAIFDPSQGPVIVRSVEKGTSFEVFQALQNEKPVGAYRLDWTHAGVGMQTVIGHGHSGYVAPFVRQSNIIAGYAARFTYFSDFWDMPAYDSAFRTGETEWMTKNRAQHEASHLLIRSKLVAMGLSVATVAMGGTHKAYTQRAEFEILVSKHGLPTKRPVPL